MDKYLLDIETREQIDRDPLRGALFENMIVLELMKTRYNQGNNPNLYYFRDQNRYEAGIQAVCYDETPYFINC